MQQSDDDLEEFSAWLRRLREENIVGLQTDLYRLSQGLTTLQRTLQESFNLETNTLSDPAQHFGAFQANAELQRYGHEVSQRMAAALEQMRHESFNHGNNTLSTPAPSSGVPQAIISRLRSYEYTQELDAVRKEKIVTCSICLGDVDIGQKVRVLTCQHEFHAPCVDKRLLEKPTCPMCRSAVQ